MYKRFIIEVVYKFSRITALLAWKGYTRANLCDYFI